MSLSTKEQAALRAFLEERFSLTELKNLAFDMGIWYEVFTHTTLPDFSRELLAFCIRRGLENCLLDKARQLRPDENWLTMLAARLPPCDNGQKVQIVVAETLLPAMQLVLEDLARRLNIPSDAITLVAASWGSMRILLSLPTAALDSDYKQIASLVNGRYHVLSIEAYIFLDATTQETWRQIATMYPPMLKDGGFYASVGWETVYETVKAATGEKAPVSLPPASSDHWLSQAENQAHLLSMSRELVSKLAPGEINRLENLFPQYTELAQVGQVTTVRQAQAAFGLGGSVESMVFVLLPVLFTVINMWVGQRNRQTLMELKLQQGADRELLYRLLEDALKQNHVVRSEREKLRPYLAETIAKEIGDTFSAYELGLRKLGEKVGLMSELLIYEQQLREIISQARRYGDTSERASRRSEIIEQLNRFSLRETHQTFNDLCGIASANYEMLPESAQDKPTATTEEKKTRQKAMPEKSRFSQARNTLRRLLTREPSTKQAKPIYGSIQQQFLWTKNPDAREFIRTVTLEAVSRVDKEEIDFFDDFLAKFFENPSPPDTSNRRPDHAFGAGWGEFVFLFTPTIAAITVAVLTLLSEYRSSQQTTSNIESELRELQTAFDPVEGMNILVNRTPPNHPRRGEVDLLQFRLMFNFERLRRYGRSSDQVAELNEIVEHINPVSYAVCGVSFNALSGLGAGMTDKQLRQLHQQIWEIARNYGISNEDQAKALADTTLATIISELVSGQHDPDQDNE